MCPRGKVKKVSPGRESSCVKSYYQNKYSKNGEQTIGFSNEEVTGEADMSSLVEWCWQRGTNSQLEGVYEKGGNRELEIGREISFVF